MLAATENQRFAEVHGPADSQGKWFPNIGIVDPSARGICRCVDRRTRLADCVYSVTALVISERAASIFKNLNLADGTAFLPVDVIAKDGRSLATMACVLFPMRVKAVDLEASKYEKLSGGIPWYFTEPPVVRAAALREIDLLMCESVHWVCSGRLKREVEKHELSNFAFEPLVLK
jgi:hypothetical protein